MPRSRLDVVVVDMCRYRYRYIDQSRSLCTLNRKVNVE